ncbi:MAG: GNAT family N-acetyltransferase [Deltaproteobacteria bacterium]|nr:GNAT family N-acetyltransferase [Deltaproteobacteria bacterium]
MAFIAALSGEVFYRYGPYEELLPQWFLSGFARTLVAELDDRPIGYVMLGMNKKWGNSVKIAELLAIAVDPHHCRCGVGEQLMRELIEMAETLKVEILILHTGVRNLHAQKLFRKHGFSPVGIKDSFYQEGQRALMMEKKMSHFPTSRSVPDDAQYLQ